MVKKLLRTEIERAKEKFGRLLESLEILDGCIYADIVLGVSDCGNRKCVIVANIEIGDVSVYKSGHDVYFYGNDDWVELEDGKVLDYLKSVLSDES